MLRYSPSLKARSVSVLDVAFRSKREDAFRRMWMQRAVAGETKAHATGFGALSGRPGGSREDRRHALSTRQQSLPLART
jgi:hypothetical protein